MNTLLAPQIPNFHAHLMNMKYKTLARSLKFKIFKLPKIGSKMPFIPHFYSPPFE